MTSNVCPTGPRGTLMSFITDNRVVLRLRSRQAKGNNDKYQQKGAPLRSVSHQRDLGVIVGETLKPHHQRANAMNNANSIRGFIQASLINTERPSATTWNIHSKSGGRGLKKRYNAARRRPEALGKHCCPEICNWFITMPFFVQL